MQVDTRKKPNDFTSSEQDYQSSIWMGKYQRNEISGSEFLWRMNEIGIHMSIINLSIENRTTSNIPAEEVQIQIDDKLSYEETYTTISLAEKHAAGEITTNELVCQINSYTAITVKNSELMIISGEKSYAENGDAWIVFNDANMALPSNCDVDIQLWIEKQGGKVVEQTIVNKELLGYSYNVAFVEVEIYGERYNFSSGDVYASKGKIYISRDKLAKILGTQGVGAAKDFVYIPKSDSIESPNCYAFAIGEDINRQPGFTSGREIDYNKKYSVDTVVSYTIDDLNNLGRSARIIDGANGAILNDERRIAVRVGTEPIFNYDYHFMVQNNDGTWSEKHGSGGESISHNEGQTPDNISWDRGIFIGYYDSEIVYLAITN